MLAAITALNDAITAQTPGNKASTKLVKDKAYQLIRILKVFACYVEYISNDVAAVALTSGFSIRSTSSKTKAPLAAAHTGIVGEIELTAKAQTGAAYIYAYNATPANPATWVTAATSKKAKHVITGLTPGVAYGYRVALVTKAGQQAWSDVIVLIVL